MKRILINALREGELRVALVNEDRLYDLCIESDFSEQKKANIYKGTITRVEPSLEAAFVDYGEAKQGFLPFKDIAVELYPECEGDYTKLAEMLQPEQTLIIQVEKEERGNKGASLTTKISLAGQYLILIPQSSANRTNGVSRSVSSNDRKEVRDLLDQLVIPENVRVIVRTSGAVRTAEELQWNLDYLLKLWEMIESNYVQIKDDKENHLLYREGNAISRTLRDYLKDDIDEVIIDEQKVFEKINGLIGNLMPNMQKKILQHSPKNGTLFAHYNVENQVETVYGRRVSLPSGGEIVIDPTEALISIDVNSGKSTQGKDIEETALVTNLEATAEIVRQLRLRDLGGLIVVDFIDMSSTTNRRRIEETFLELSRDDRARIKVGRISRFGLLELSRQHIGSPITNLKIVKCSECGGTNMIRSINSQSESIIGLIETRANAKGIAQIQVQLPVDNTTHILNEKRDELHKIENRHGIKIIVIANEQMQHPNYFIRSISYGEINNKNSYQHKRPVEKKKIASLTSGKAKRRALVGDVMPDTAPKKKSLLSRIFGTSSTSTSTPTSSPAEPEEKTTPKRNKTNNYRHRNRSRNYSNPRNSANKSNPERTSRTNSNRANNTGKTEAEKK
jgi:ribonuclease E